MAGKNETGISNQIHDVSVKESIPDQTKRQGGAHSGACSQAWHGTVKSSKGLSFYCSYYMCSVV